MGDRKREGAAPYDYAGGDDRLDYIPPPTTEHVALFLDKGAHEGITPRLITQMQLLVAGGTPIPVAAVAMGLGMSRVNHWLRKGREAEKDGLEPGFEEGLSKELALLQALDQAKASLEAAMALRITAAAAKDWKAAAYLLERRAGSRWREVKETKVTVTKESDDTKNLSQAELLALATQASESKEE